MGNLGGYFDSTAIDPSGSGEPIPAGEYVVIIAESEVKTAKSGNNYLSMKFQVADGPHSGRVFFSNFNLWHEKEEVRKISEGQLSGICRALNRSGAQDSAELHDQPFYVRVSVKPDANGEMRNNLSSVVWKKTAKGEGKTVAVSGAKAPTTKVAVTSGPSLDDDEIPFG